jgi:PKD repeat protein
MAKILIKYNNSLLRRNGNIYDGYEGTPICNFNASGSSASQVSIAQNSSLNFYDTSLKSPTNWNWNFGSGTPSTSTQQNPTGITFNVTGLTSISLSVTNIFGSNSKTKIDYINVQNPTYKKLAINLFANEISPYESGVTWTPSGMSERIWTWNHMSGYTTPLPSLANLRYTDNSVSSYGVRIMNAEGGFEGYSNGAQSASENGIYPNKIMLYNLANVSYPEKTWYVEVNGLNVSTTYKFTMFGSRVGSGTVTYYTITGGTSKDGTTVNLDTKDNIMNTISVTGITPSSGGIIQVSFVPNGYFGAIEIDEEG